MTILEELRFFTRRFFFKVWESLFGQFANTRYLSKFRYGPVFGSVCLLVTCDGSKFYCPIEDISVITEVYYEKVYDLYFEPSRGFKVIDVGGHVGAYAVKAGRKVGHEGSVLSAEPHPSNFEALVKNVRMNNLEKTVIPIQVALADYNGTGKLYLNPEWPRGHSIMPIYEQSIEVPVKKLDDIAHSFNVLPCDILKIDVEGAELDVLKGAEKVLKETTYVVVAAYHTAGKWQKTKEVDVVQCFLEKLEFKTFLYLQNIGPDRPPAPYVYGIRAH